MVIGSAALIAGLGAVIAVRLTTSSRPVAVIGDSITFFAGHDISRSLPRPYHADIHAGIGRRIDEMLPDLAKAIQAHPAAVVVNLGTNDALQVSTHPDWQSGFARMISAVTRTKCAIIMTISTVLPGPSVIRRVAANIDREISAAVAVHPNLHIADWKTSINASNGASLLMPDKVHPSAAGQLTLAALVGSALKACHLRSTRDLEMTVRHWS